MSSKGETTMSHTHPSRFIFVYCILRSGELVRGRICLKRQRSDRRHVEVLGQIQQVSISALLSNTWHRQTLKIGPCLCTRACRRGSLWSLDGKTQTERGHQSREVLCLDFVCLLKVVGQAQQWYSLLLLYSEFLFLFFSISIIKNACYLMWNSSYWLLSLLVALSISNLHISR